MSGENTRGGVSNGPALLISVKKQGASLLPSGRTGPDKGAHVGNQFLQMRKFLHLRAQVAVEVDIAAGGFEHGLDFRVHDPVIDFVPKDEHIVFFVRIGVDQDGKSTWLCCW